MRLVASRSMLNARHSRTDRVHAQKQLGMGSALRCTIGPREDDPTATQHSQHANRQRAKRKERKAPGIPLSYDRLLQPRKCERRSNTNLRSHRERDKRARKQNWSAVKPNKPLSWVLRAESIRSAASHSAMRCSSKAVTSQNTSSIKREWCYFEQT